MNITQTLTGLALGAALLGGSLAPQTSFAAAVKIQKKAAKSQNVTVFIDSSGFHPAAVNVKAGQPVHLIFASKGSSCANHFSIPALKKTVSLQPGQKKEIVFTAKRGQTIAFACSMKMFKGTVKAK